VPSFPELESWLPLSATGLPELSVPEGCEDQLAKLQPSFVELLE
jgi:hypothetical protein